MKNLFIILIAFSLVGCMASKEVRQSKRCNKKLAKLLVKCPELQKVDTIQIPFMVIVPQLEIKDSITVRVDTVELLKYVEISKIKNIIKTITIDTMDLNDKYHLIISLRNGILNYKVIILSDTIQSVLNVPKITIAPIKITWLMKAKQIFVEFRLLLIIFFIFVAISFIIRKYLL